MWFPFLNQFFKVIIGAVIIGAIFNNSRVFRVFISIICSYCHVGLDLLTDCTHSVTCGSWRNGFSGFTRVGSRAIR